MKKNKVRFGFVGKEMGNEGVFNKKNLKKISSYYLNKRIVFMEQVHSNNVEIINKMDVYNSTDAMITNSRDVVLTGTFADCMPIYFYVKNTNIIALAHSGWRGSKLNISLKVIDIIKSKYSVKVDDILVEIGPCIKWQNYEVQEEFIKNFELKYFYNVNNKIYFDLKKYNYDIIKSVIPTSNIKIDSRCTYDDKKLHSYRRDKQKSGRNIAFIYNV